MQNNIFQDFANSLINIEKIMINELPEVAENIVVRVKARIFTGRGTEGVIMTTKSRVKIGRYGAWHGGNRRRRGLQTDVVNLEYTGKMMNDYGVINKSRTSIGIGFKSDSESEKMEENEKIYGFVIADVEDAFIDSESDKYFDRVLKELGI
jgi:hypothetical protein